MVNVKFEQVSKKNMHLMKMCILFPFPSHPSELLCIQNSHTCDRQEGNSSVTQQRSRSTDTVSYSTNSLMGAVESLAPKKGGK